MKRLLSLILACALLLGLSAVATAEAKPFDGVTITVWMGKTEYNEVTDELMTKWGEENGVTFKEGTEYLVCLGKNDDGTYMVLAEAYGVSAVENGQVTNRVNGEKISVDELGH